MDTPNGNQSAAFQRLEAEFGGAARDDISADYQARMDEMHGNQAFRRLEAEFGSSAPTQPAATGATAQPAKGDDDGGPMGMGGMGRIAKDFFRGLTEAPGQIISGVRDAAQETVDLWLQAGDWLEKKLPITPGYDPNTPPSITLPKPVGDADSATGKVVHDISQFVAGFIGAGKLKVFQAIQPATRGGKFAKAAGRGAVADFTVFDEQESRLSDLIESVPALQNPVTRFLASNPDDNAAESRFKRALEGVGVGGAVEGLVVSLKAMRAARIARNQARAVDRRAATPGKSAAADIKVMLGDADDEALVRVEAPDPATAKLAEGVEKTAGTDPAAVGKVAADAAPAIEINFARINAPDDIKATIQQLADAHAGDINAARRGVRTWADTQLSAQQVDAWNELMQRAPAGTLNAEQSLAARQLWVTSAGKLSEVARLAADSPSEANLVAFRKMLATHYAIQKEVISARTETARALNAWKIPASSRDNAIFGTQLEMLVDASGGTALSQDMARRIAALSDAGMVRELEKVVEGSALARTRAAFQQVWINSLLSNPATHVVNAVSNWSVIGQQMLERRVAAAISEAVGTEGGVAVGEAAAMMGAVVSGFRDAMRAAYKTARTGESSLGLMRPDVADRGLPGALSSEAFQMATDTPLGKALDLVDATTRIPGRALATSDEFFKSIGYRMEVHAQATRQAQDEVAVGFIQPDELKARIGQLVNDPPEHIRLEAVDAALYQTFSNKPAATLKGLADKWQAVPVLGVLTLPFKNTPINILTYTAERSPMAPLVRQWREDVAAGGARRDLAIARVATGTTLLAAMIDAALSGNITGKGPTRPEERQNWMRQGNQQYSVKVGDRWYAYSRLDPIGMTVGMAADIADAMVNAGTRIEQGSATYNATEEAVQSAALAIAKNVTSKTYMSGVAQFLDAISNPDMHGEKYFQSIAASFIPALAGTVTRQIDPYMRTAQTSIEAMQRKSPFHSSDLPLYRDLWGRPVDYRSGAGALVDILSPVYTKKHAPEPIDAEMERLGFFPGMPEKRVNFNGAVIDLEDYPPAYERYVELAGNGQKHPSWNMGAMDLLNAIVSGEHPLSNVYKLYSDGRDGGKADFIRDIMSQFRGQAKEELLREFDDLRAEYEGKRKPFGNRLDPALFGG